MRLIDADRLLDRCIFYHLPNGDLAVPIIDVQHAPTVEAPDINVGNMDTISRQAAKDIFTELYGISAIGSVFDKYEWADICETTANELPSVQPTLYGYNIGHLELIARVLQKEDLPPERVVEALTDIGRIVAIVRDALKEKVFHNLSDEFYGAMQVLDELPSIQPEHKTGRWIPDNTDYYHTKFICSACGESEEVPTTGFGYGTMWDYCPMCGAKMERGEQE